MGHGTSLIDLEFIGIGGATAHICVMSLRQYAPNGANFARVAPVFDARATWIVSSPHAGNTGILHPIQSSLSQLSTPSAKTFFPLNKHYRGLFSVGCAFNAPFFSTTQSYLNTSTRTYFVYSVSVPNLRFCCFVWALNNCFVCCKLVFETAQPISNIAEDIIHIEALNAAALT